MSNILFDILFSFFSLSCFFCPSTSLSCLLHHSSISKGPFVFSSQPTFNFLLCPNDPPYSESVLLFHRNLLPCHLSKLNILNNCHIYSPLLYSTFILHFYSPLLCYHIYPCISIPFFHMDNQISQRLLQLDKVSILHTFQQDNQCLFSCCVIWYLFLKYNSSIFYHFYIPF